MPPVGRHIAVTPLHALVLVAAGLTAACLSDSPTGPGSGSGAVAAVVVTATRSFLAPGDTLQLVAQVMDAEGRVLPAEPVTWSSSLSSVARVSGQGLVNADSVGDVTITASSGGKTGTVDLVVGVSVLCACTRIIDSTAVTLVSRDDTSGTYVFRVLRGPPPAVDSGAILVGAEGEGYIRRVQHASLVGDVLTVETTQAYLEEAVQEGGFATTAFTDSGSAAGQPSSAGWVGPWQTTYMSSGVSLNRAGRCCSLNGLSFAIKLTPSPGTPVSGTVDFTINQGSIDFTPRVAMVTKVSAFQLRRFEHVLRGDLGLNIDEYELKVTISGSPNKSIPLAKEKKNFIIQQRPYATFIGPMPVIVIFTRKFSLEITPTVSASAVFTGAYHSSLGIEAGVRWTDPGGWRPVFGASSSLDATAPQFKGVQGSASVKIAVVPEFNALIYGVVGPFINLEPYAEAKASSILSFAGGSPSGLDWETGIAIGLNLNMGAKLSVMGRKDLFEVGFSIPLVKPLPLIRAFSDGPLTIRTATAGQDIPATFGVQLRPAFVDQLPLFGVRDLSGSTVDTTIGPTDTLLLDNIRSGAGFPHRLGLTGIAGNCYDSLPNPDTVAVGSHGFIALGGTPTDTLFRVNCIPLGDLAVSTVTTGPQPPPRFRMIFQRRDTAGVGRADTPDTVSIPGGMAPADTVLEDFIPVNPRRGGTGRLDATLEPGRRNCAVARPSTSQLVIQSGDTVAAQYLVTCVPLGSIAVQAATIDPDPPPPVALPGQGARFAQAASTIQYDVHVAPQAARDSVPVQPGPVAASDSVMVDSLVPLYNASGAPGRYTTQLTGAPNRCADPQGMNRTVTVQPGDTAIADYDIRCVERLHVATATSGPGTDPDGYGVVMVHPDGTTDTVSVGANDTAHVAGLAAGQHVLSLSGVETSCQAPSSQTVTVSAQDSTLVRFVVSCPAPPPPSGLQLTQVTTSTIALAWNPAGPDSVIAGYRVYRNGALYDSTTATAYSDTGLPPFTSFTYQVSSVNTGGLEGIRSAQLAARTLDATPPTAPVNLVAGAAGGFQVDLAWGAASDPETGIARYLIQRDGVLIDSTTGLSYADTLVTPGNTYGYTVSAVNGAGLEGAGAAASTTTPVLATTGELRVTVTTSGVVPPGPFEVRLEGPAQLTSPVDPNGTALFTSMVPGTYTVILRNEPANCTVTAPNPRPVDVVAGQQAKTTYTVACQ